MKTPLKLCCAALLRRPRDPVRSSPNQDPEWAVGAMVRHHPKGTARLRQEAPLEQCKLARKPAARPWKRQGQGRAAASCMHDHTPPDCAKAPILQRCGNDAEAHGPA